MGTGDCVWRVRGAEGARACVRVCVCVEEEEEAGTVEDTRTMGDGCATPLSSRTDSDTLVRTMSEKQSSALELLLTGRGAERSGVWGAGDELSCWWRPDPLGVCAGEEEEEKEASCSCWFCCCCWWFCWLGLLTSSEVDVKVS
jgi:hypothetical protein